MKARRPVRLDSGDKRLERSAQCRRNGASPCERVRVPDCALFISAMDAGSLTRRAAIGNATAHGGSVRHDIPDAIAIAISAREIPPLSTD